MSEQKITTSTFRTARFWRVWLKWPVAWFLAEQLLLLVWYARNDELRADPNHHHDTYHSMNASTDPAYSAKMLNHYVSPGYPSLIRLVRFFTPDLALLPWVHLAFVALAAASWYRGMRRLGCEAGTSFLLAAPLLCLPAMSFEFSPAAIATDLTGLALAIAAIGVFFVLLRPGARLRDWVSFSLLVFCAIQVRPAYLFLLPLFPILAVACLRNLASREQYLRLRWVLARTVLLAMLPPLLLFCCYRRVMVGEFGLSSASGFNLIGITGQLLTPEMVPELPADLQRFARNVIRYRAEPEWMGGHYISPLGGPNGLTGQRLRDNFNLLVWYAGFKAAADEHPNDIAGMNRLLTRFSTQVIRLRPRLYLTWVALNSGRSLFVLFNTPYFLTLFVLSIVGYVAVAVARSLGLSFASGPRNLARHLKVAETCTLVGVLFYVSKLAEVALVEVAMRRYVLAAAAMFPTISMGLLLLAAQAARPAKRKARDVNGYPAMARPRLAS